MVGYHIREGLVLGGQPHPPLEGGRGSGDGVPQKLEHF